MTLIERLRALGLRREAEGIYTDQNICEAAIEEIERLSGEVDSLRKRWSEGITKLLDQVSENRKIIDDATARMARGGL